MSDDDCALVVLLRQAQWLCDDLAHQLPRGITPERRREAADLLEQVAQLLLGSAHQVVEGEQACP